MELPLERINHNGERCHVCPDCGGDMYEDVPDDYICADCVTKFKQMWRKDGVQYLRHSTTRDTYAQDVPDWVEVRSSRYR